MDPVTLGVILGVAAITAAATVIYWTKILQWGMGSLLPWVQRYVPELEPAVREAFTYVDSIAVPTYVVVKEAWRNVRRVLADQVQVFEQETNGEWVVKVITKVRKTIEVAAPAATEIVQFTTVEHLAYDELPPPVRANWLRTGKSRYEFNLTEQRDNELRLGFSV